MKEKPFTLESNSPERGRIDPVAKRSLMVGDLVIRCGRGHVSLKESWDYLGNKCPICRETTSTRPDIKGPKSLPRTRPSESTPIKQISTSLIALLLIGAVSLVAVGAIILTALGIAASPTQQTVIVQQTVVVTRPSSEATSTRSVQNSAGGASSPTANQRPTSTHAPSIDFDEVLLGRSANGTSIKAMKFGDGRNVIVFVGGLHDGFAPATVNLAERAIEYFSSNPNAIPNTVTLYIVESANPDSPYNPGELSGRLNGNGVDPNRNWDCDWVPNPVWRSQNINGGSEPFSEPETRALRDFFLETSPKAVVFWEARMPNGLVSPGGCGNNSRVSESLSSVYGRAAGYTVDEFTAYAVNGDATNWLDNQGIPAVSVLLPSYTSIDWSNHRDGILAVLEAYD